MKQIYLYARTSIRFCPRESEEKTEGTKRRKKERESEGRNDSVFTDEVGDTIASRTKQRRRNRQQDDDDEDDDNNSYEY